MSNDNVVMPGRLAKGRVELFHKKCIEKCRSKKTFDEGFLVDKSHIAKGILKNPKRSALTNEDIAAVIQQGILHYETCTYSYPIEIVVKGIIKDFEWTDLSSRKIATYIEDKVEVKVVIRERRPRDIIVTAYITDMGAKISTNKEISREIW
ncbi:MAG: hypothetical protein HQK53_11140 [Oligoflexia bacterium]|nr:hypothetical protein [Oligoflexia bacterium]